MTPGTDAPRRKHNNFDFIRFVAATMVVISHMYALKGKPEPLFLKYQTLGGLGVLIFFSISGYLVAQSWQRDPNVLRFLIRRFLRLWPALAVIVLFAALVLGPLTTTLPLAAYFHDPTFKSYFTLLAFLNQVFLPGTFTGNPIPNLPNGALWTIPLEVRCYAFLAICGVVGLLRRKWTLLVMFVAVVIGYYGVHHAQRLFDTTHQLRAYQVEFGGFFLAGCVLHYFSDEIWCRKPDRAIAIAYAAGLLSICFHQELLAAMFIVPISVIVCGSASTPVISSWHRIGDLSYGIYIWGFPVQQTFVWLTHNRLRYWPTLLSCYAITLVLAWLSWNLVEQPALKLKPRTTKRIKPGSGVSTELASPVS